MSLDRPLRVIGLGWELLAPGIWANDGLTPGQESAFSSRGLEVHLTIAPDMVAIERALAAGGEHPEGVDVAVIPLSALVVSFADLEPLWSLAELDEVVELARQGVAEGPDPGVQWLAKLRPFLPANSSFFSLSRPQIVQVLRRAQRLTDQEQAMMLRSAPGGMREILMDILQEVY